MGYYQIHRLAKRIGLEVPQKYTDIQASVSGGTSITQFQIGANYHRETAVFPGNFSDQKGGMHVNIKNVSTNRRFIASFSGNFLKDKNMLPINDLTQQAVIPSSQLLQHYTMKTAHIIGRITHGIIQLQHMLNKRIELTLIIL